MLMFGPKEFQISISISLLHTENLSRLFIWFSFSTEMGKLLDLNRKTKNERNDPEIYPQIEELEKNYCFTFWFPREWENCPCPDACQVLREHLRVFFGVAQGDSQGLVCGCSRFQTVTREWEKREKHSQIKHNSQEMSQNTCERSGVRKYKLRVQYFDHVTQKKMVIDSGEKKIWNFMETFMN